MYGWVEGLSGFLWTQTLRSDHFVDWDADRTVIDSTEWKPHPKQVRGAAPELLKLRGCWPLHCGVCTFSIVSIYTSAACLLLNCRLLYHVVSSFKMVWEVTHHLKFFPWKRNTLESVKRPGHLSSPTVVLHVKACRVDCEMQSRPCWWGSHFLHTGIAVPIIHMR